MSDLTVKIAQADPEVREHIEALRKGMLSLQKRSEIAEKIARDMNMENTRLRKQIAEMQGPPPGVWGSYMDDRPDAD